MFTLVMFKVKIVLWYQVSNSWGKRRREKNERKNSLLDPKAHPAGTVLCY